MRIWAFGMCSNRIEKKEIERENEKESYTEQSNLINWPTELSSMAKIMFASMEWPLGRMNTLSH